MPRTAYCLVAAALAVLIAPVAASAQQAPPAAAAPAQPKKPPAKESADATPSGGGSDAALRKRVEQLEEQLVDLQVVIGTLESLAKAPPQTASAPYRAPAASAPTAADQARIDGIEMQIRALTQQMEQLSADVRNGGGKTGSAGLAPPSGTMQPNASVLPSANAPAANPQPANFGAVTTAAADPIAGMIGEDQPAAAAPPAAPAAKPPAARVYPATGDDPKLAYEAAYSHMLQQDYIAAQAGFGDFLKRFPTHALVPNALYWLGETYYVQRNYADAAEAFDVVLSAHGNSNKAPDSQLKKAMALSLLGKNDDACAALRQLTARFPNAPAHVKTKADMERRRVGCS